MDCIILLRLRNRYADLTVWVHLENEADRLFGQSGPPISVP
jgi:hypothetical protein